MIDTSDGWLDENEQQRADQLKGAGEHQTLGEADRAIQRFGD